MHVYPFLRQAVLHEHPKQSITNDSCDSRVQRCDPNYPRSLFGACGQISPSCSAVGRHIVLILGSAFTIPVVGIGASGGTIEEDCECCLVGMRKLGFKTEFVNPLATAKK